jgi:heme oxygenase
MEKKKMTLKEQTQDLHEIAENNKFAQLLLSGNINKKQYAKYLSNMWFIYSILEKIAETAGVLKGIEDIKRADAIKQDILELNVGIDNQAFAPSTYMYVQYLGEMDPKKSLAHVYVRHFGDLYGGQILKTKVPGSGKMYEFANRKELINSTRALLTDDLGSEARVGFEYAIALFEDLVHELDL